MQVYTPEQARMLMRAAEGDRLEALIVMALTTGMREGELLGLRWCDVDLRRGFVQARMQVQRIRGVGLVHQEMKTVGSRRKVALTRVAVEALKRHRARQREERLAAGPAWEERDLVFCTQAGRFLAKSNVLAQNYPRIVRRAGVPTIRFHDLRHTAATLLLLQGVNPKVVSEMLGHASVAITLSLYSHVLPDMQRDATQAMDRLFGEAEATESEHFAVSFAVNGSIDEQMAEE